MEDAKANTEAEVVNEEVVNETVAQSAPKVGEQPAPVVLLGAISYTDEANYEMFLQGMDINKALFVLSSAVNFAQSKGAYSVAEAELISCATRAIRKNATPVANVDAPSEEPTSEESTN